jgi:parallel beta-helix repeat protein
MVDVKIKIALVLIAILILAAPIAIAQEVPAHVVISEVFYDESSTDNNEFCVLYNPSDSDIDIGGWKLKAFNQAGVLKTTTTLPDSTITAHKFYLIGEKNPLNSSDWSGTEISPDCLRGGSDWQNGPDDYLVLEDSGGNYIDGVRWGHKDGNNPLPIPDVPDNNTAPDAAAGKSIKRKPLGGGYAPCQDTDDNFFDFVEQGTPTPKNSLSPEMEPAPVELFDADGDFKGGFVSIQDAVDNASDGYTIRVDDGTYNENLAVAKQLTICSEHGAAFTTVSALDSNDHVIAVTADHVTITGFNVVGATQKAGIYLCTADSCHIANNSASNNKIGIHLQMGSQGNTIMNNTVSNNIQRGIWLASSSSNTITNNNATTYRTTRTASA